MLGPLPTSGIEDASFETNKTRLERNQNDPNLDKPECGLPCF